MKKKNNYWSPDKDNFLINNFYDKNKLFLVNNLNRKWKSIVYRAYKLGLKRKRADLWLNWEIEYLKNNYSLLPSELILKTIQNRTWEAIVAKANSIGLVKENKCRMLSGINHYYFDTWSSNMAYVLGFISADGSIIDENTGVCINLSKKDEKHLQFIRDEIAPGTNIRYYSVIKNNKTFEYISLRVYSRYMADILISLKIIPRKSNILEMSPVPEEYVVDFIRGNFDGDGCISKNLNRGSWNFVFLGTKLLLNDFQKYINKNCNVNTNINVCKIKNKIALYSLNFSTYDAIKIGAWLYGGEIKDGKVINLNPKFHLERKYNKYLQMIKEFGYMED